MPRIKVVEEEINQDARHRHVHPDRPGPAGDLFMKLVAFLQCAVHGDQRQRHDRHRQQDVGNEHRVIERSNRSYATKRRVHSFDQDLVNDIGHQEDARSHERRYHAVAVSELFPALDEDVTGEQENGREAIQRRVERGQIVDGHGCFSLPSCSTALRMRLRVRVQFAARSASSNSSSRVSKAPRSRPCLSTTTKIVLWTNKSAGPSRSSGFFSTVVSFRPSTATRKSSALAPVRNHHRLACAPNRSAYRFRTGGESNSGSVVSETSFTG